MDWKSLTYYDINIPININHNQLAEKKIMTASIKLRRIFILTLLSTFTIYAQTSISKDSTKTYLIKQVVITAPRLSGENMKTPLAIDVVDVDEFTQQRLMGLGDALGLVPGVNAQSRAGGQDVRLTVRGFGARGSGDRSNAATIRGVRVLLDGIPETEPDGRTALDLIDMDAIGRIEVVRSNASTLFGNASGGVINLETGRPFTQTFADLKNMFGSFGLRKSNLTLGSVFGSSKLLLSATNTDFDGWRQSSANKSTQVHAVLTANLDMTTSLKVLASGSLNKFWIPGALTKTQFDSSETQANPTYFKRNERRMNKTGRLAVEFSKVFGGEHNIDVLAYVAPKVLTRSERNTYRNFNRFHIGGGAVYTWINPGESFLKKIVGGVDEAYQDGAILFYNLINGERGDSLRNNKREGAETFGVFLQTEVKLLDPLSLTLGIRYDKQRYIAEEFAAGTKRFDSPDRLSLNHFTPKAALLYHISENHSLYVNVGGGLEAPAFNEVDPPPSIPNVKLNPLLAPMTSTTVEIGAKGYDLFTTNNIINSYSYSIAAYHIGIQHEIIPYDGGIYYFSAGKSRRYGLEVGGQLQLFERFFLTTAVTYMNARYQSYVNDLGDFSDNIVPGIPFSIIKSRLRYSVPFGLNVEVGMENVGKCFADDANKYEVDASTILNASLGYNRRIGIFTFNGFVGINNIADVKYVSSAFINPVGGAFIEPGLPRNYYGGLSVKLDM
jgi:iron complex outermembrane recepter protein